MRHRFTAVQRGQPFLHFPPEPIVMVQICRHQLLHDLVRGFALLRSDSREPSFNFGAKKNFIETIVGGGSIPSKLFGINAKQALLFSTSFHSQRV